MASPGAARAGSVCAAPPESASCGPQPEHGPMSYRPYQHIERRKSRQIHVGPVPVGGDAPITVQTMTNTPTTDVAATVAQIRRAERAGVDIVRVSCPDAGERAGAEGHHPPGGACRSWPTSTSTTSAPSRRRRAGAACLRINPGNIGSRRAGARGDQGGARPQLLHAHRRERRLAGAPPAGEIRRAQPGGAGGERAGHTPRSCRTTTSTSSRSA